MGKAHTRTAVAAIVIAALASGCFALFPLDDYGPPSGDGGASDVSRDGPPGGPDAAVFNGKVVFVTADSVQVGGDAGFDGTFGANEICNKAASRVGLPGTFLAWLSNGKDAPLFSVFLDGGVDNTQIVTTDHRLVASNYAELRDSGPRLAIAATEDGKRLPDGVLVADGGCTGDGLVWTGTKGQPADGPSGCQAWTSSFPFDKGGVGRISADRTQWTFVCNQACNLTAHLYCFQQ
jgi:hypothetical protein